MGKSNMMTNKDLDDYLKKYSEYNKLYSYKHAYSTDDSIDDVCIDYILDSLTWTNIKSKLKKLIYYLR